MKGKDKIIVRDVELSATTSKQYLVRIRTGKGEYEGLLFSPYPDKRLSEVLAKMETFLNLKDAKDLSSR